MAQIGTIGKRTGRHSDLLSKIARCPQSGLKEGSRNSIQTRWASTLSADRMRPERFGDLNIFFLTPPSQKAICNRFSLFPIPSTCSGILRVILAKRQQHIDEPSGFVFLRSACAKPGL